MNIRLQIVLLTASLSVMGCATLTRGTTQSVSVDSKPAAAKIASSTGPSCTAPCIMELKRNSDHTITASKLGYEDVSAVVSSSLGGGGAAGMIGNLLVSGPIGMGVDAASGAMFDLNPDTLTLVLKKDPTLAQQ